MKISTLQTLVAPIATLVTIGTQRPAVRTLPAARTSVAAGPYDVMRHSSLPRASFALQNQRRALNAFARCLAFFLIGTGITSQAALSAATLRAPAKHASDAAIEAQCERYFHDGCSEAMGRWLPHVGYENGLPERATHIDKYDGFAYQNARPWSADAPLEFIGPADGTFFVYGEAGPPKGRAVYDRVHRIAYYGQGCCSWKEAVVAANVPAPPKALKNSDLSTLSTLRGIRLGQTESQLLALNGKATPVPVRGHPGVSLVTYSTWPPVSSPQYQRTRCGQTQYYFFRERRLVLIKLENAC